MILGCFIGYFCPGKFPKNSVLSLKKQIPHLWISNPLQSFVPAFVLTSHINLANKETSTFVRVFWASFVTLWLEVWPYVYKWEFIIVFLSAGSFSLTLCFHLHFWPVSKVCSQIHKFTNDAWFGCEAQILSQPMNIKQFSSIHKTRPICSFVTSSRKTWPFMRKVSQRPRKNTSCAFNNSLKSQFSFSLDFQKANEQGATGRMEQGRAKNIGLKNPFPPSAFLCLFMIKTSWPNFMSLPMMMTNH